MIISYMVMFYYRLCALQHLFRKIFMSKFTGEFKGNDAGRDKLRNFKATIPGKICASILGRQPIVNTVKF